MVEANRRGAIELLEFTAEPGSWRSFSGPGGGRLILKPDAYVRTGAGEYEQLWFVEIDLNTESWAALARKLRRYRQFWVTGREQAQTTVFPHVLLLANGSRRREVLAEVVASQPRNSQQPFKIGGLDNAVESFRTGGAP